MPPTRQLSLLILLVAAACSVASCSEVSFAFHGFKDNKNLSLAGSAEITSNGLLRLTNDTQQAVGRAFYRYPLRFSPAVSFSCVFVVAIVPKPQFADHVGHGVTFALVPSLNLPSTPNGQTLGLLNSTDKATATSSTPNVSSSSSQHVVAVELDTVKNSEFKDIDNNHVGVDVNSMESIVAASAADYDSATASFKNFSLLDGHPVWVWVDYDGSRKRMNVSVARKGVLRPAIPLLRNVPVDVPAVAAAESYVGFTAATGSATETHYVLGWSFATGGSAAPKLDPSKLPKVPKRHKSISVVLAAGISLVVAAVLVLAVVFGGRFLLIQRRRYAEELEDWEAEYGPHRFSYKDLYKATAGFEDSHHVGTGGFGKVYYGKMSKSGEEVAVKRVSHDSRQGTREFVAEVASMGRLRHRNLVRLLGYCRRRGEMLLVYEFMHSGSLDHHLFRRGNGLDWPRRFHIIKGVAAGLLYLHEGWEQVVVHRDIKAANVLLDNDLNPKLGDFGLARLYDRGANPTTTHVVGTLGYLAPEMSQTGKATTATDVYAYGAFLLEVVTGRRPVEPNPSTLKEGSEKGHVHGPQPGEALVDWVLNCWRKGDLLLTVDARLPASGGYNAGEAEMVLRLGVMCSHPDPAARLGMRQVVGILEGEAVEPPASPDAIKACSATMRRSRAFDEFSMSNPLLTATTATTMSATTVESSFGSRSSRH